MENIVLIGFMGSGKTTIGREIALLGGRFLLDTDGLIEQNMGKSVREIFASVGEKGFRKIESQLILWLPVAECQFTMMCIIWGKSFGLMWDLKALLKD